MSSYYLVTYKVLRNYPSPTQVEYDSVFPLLKKKGEIIHYAFEHDSRGKLHFHCMYKMQKNSYIKNFMMKGFHMNFTPIEDTPEDIQRVRDYIFKEQLIDQEKNNDIVQQLRVQYAFDNEFIPD